MAEEVVYEDGNFKITSARIVTPSQTIALSGIFSVSMAKESPSYTGPIVLILIGIAVCFANFIIGIVLIALGVFWWTRKKSVYYLVLDTAAGKVNSFSSYDMQYIIDLEQAVNDAIIARG